MIWHHVFKSKNTQHNDFLLCDTQHLESQLKGTQDDGHKNNDTQLKDTQHNDCQHNDTQLNETHNSQHSETQHYDPQHNSKKVTLHTEQIFSAYSQYTEFCYDECPHAEYN